MGKQSESTQPVAWSIPLFVWAATGVGRRWMEVMCAHRGWRTEVMDVHLNHTACRICFTGSLISLSIDVVLVSVSLNHHS